MTPDRLALPALLLAAALMLQGCATAPSVPAGQESGTDAGAGTPAGTASAPAPPQAGVADAATHAQHLLHGMAQDLTAIAAGAPLPALGQGRRCDHCAARGLCRRDFWEETA